MIENAILSWLYFHSIHVGGQINSIQYEECAKNQLNDFLTSRELIFIKLKTLNCSLLLQPAVKLGSECRKTVQCHCVFQIIANGTSRLVNTAEMKTKKGPVSG